MGVAPQNAPPPQKKATVPLSRAPGKALPGWPPDGASRGAPWATASLRAEEELWRRRHEGRGDGFPVEGKVGAPGDLQEL